MKNKIIFSIILILIISFAVYSCSSNKKTDNELITVSVTYKDVATESDFEKYNNVYEPGTEIKLERDNYYLIKVRCTVFNNSSQNLSGLDFVTYSDENLLYEAGAIDIEPTYPIQPNSRDSFDAYIYVNKSLDNEEKITSALENEPFNFTAFLYDKLPLEEYTTEISFQGKFQPKTESTQKQGYIFELKRFL